MNDKDYEAVLQRVRDDRDKYKAALDKIAHYVAETATSPDMYYDYPVLLKRILEDAGWRGDDE